VTALDNANQTGQDDSDAPFSLYDLVTSVVVTRLDAVPAENGISISWELAGNVFTSVSVERSVNQAGPWLAINADRHQEGLATVAVDRSAELGHSYWYRLIGVTSGGTQAVLGPVQGLAGLPKEFSLAAAWPNPTRGAISTRFAVARSSSIKLSVIDLQGREVQILANGRYQPGTYQVSWDGRTDRGGVLPAGMYFIRYQTPDKDIVSRIAITR